MKQQMRHKKKLKIRYGRVGGTIAVAVLCLIFGGYYIYKGLMRPQVVEEQIMVEQEEPIHVLTTAETSLLNDYELVRKMLMSQDMVDYKEPLIGEIQAQDKIVQDYIQTETLDKLEAATNKLAKLIDEPLFSGEPSDVFYARGLLILNKQHRAPANFEPGNRIVMKNAFAMMQKDAAAEGINLDDFSGYRSYYAQETLFNRYAASDGEEAANRYSAKAGYSEHQTGFVVDIGGDNKAAWAETIFDNTREAKWLAEHAHKYGFIMRYPPGKEAITGYIYESWHFRYIGEIATKVKESGKTLEEYLGLV